MKQASEYTRRVESYLEGLEAVSTGACPGCAECGLEDEPEMDCEAYELAGEPGFSWSPCEVCGSTLGGDRHPWHALIPKPDGTLKGAALVHGECCTDCLFFLNYGDEPEA